jgi:hypothetical protein
MTNMNNKKWTPLEEEKVLSLYDKYRTGINKMDVTNLQESELPTGRTVYAVKSLLYKQYGISCKGAGVAAKRMAKEPKSAMPKKAPVKKKRVTKTVTSESRVKTTRHSFLWGAYTFETKGF